MPRRRVDPPFAPFDDSELLFRRLRPDWIEDGEVTSDAIDMPACSVERERFVSGPDDVLRRGRPAETGVASVPVDRLPDELRYEKSPTVYETVVVHCPEHGIDGHSEIRACKNGEIKSPKKIQSSEFRSRMQAVIAKCMTISIDPGPSNDDDI